MYEQFFGFTGLPFSLLPDADFLFMSRRHKRAVNLLEYGIISNASFIVITGEVGAGKTTVIRRFIKNAERDTTIGVINNPSKVFGRLLSWIAMAFEYEDVKDDPVRGYDNFVKFLLEQYGRGRRTVLIIDEAQNLSVEMLEELRMLTNVNNEKDQLLQIVMVGQPELLEMLKRNDLRQFAQRIGVHCHLDALEPAETAAYIRHRVRLVGGKMELFNDSTCATVHYFTGGVPRLINLLCDQVLVYTFSEDKPIIDPKTVLEVVEDRSRGGLSAFRPLPEGNNLDELQRQVEAILRQMQVVEAT